MPDQHQTRENCPLLLITDHKLQYIKKELKTKI